MVLGEEAEIDKLAKGSRQGNFGVERRDNGRAAAQRTAVRGDATAVFSVICGAILPSAGAAAWPLQGSWPLK